MRLFAFLVGVDLYQDETYNLHGAVNDAKRMKSFLLDRYLDGSRDRIVFLQDRNATASRIVKGLEDLHLNEDIKHGDPILFYYAGRGSKLSNPPGLDSANPHGIQCLSPHDARRGPDGTVVGVILDRTLDAILERLAVAKGNNIVRVLMSPTFDVPYLT